MLNFSFNKGSCFSAVPTRTFTRWESPAYSIFFVAMAANKGFFSIDTNVLSSSINLAILIAEYATVFSQVAWSAMMNTIKGTSREELVLNHVFQFAKENDPESVVAAIDEFGRTKQFLMNVGDSKGKHLDDVVIEKKPKFAVELGAYCGYSAIRIARLMDENTKFVSIEKNPLYAAIATKNIEYAGLSHRVKVLVGTAEKQLPTLKQRFNITHIDLLFIDHWKDRYLPDLKIAESTGLLSKGSVIVADNIIVPGAPGYLEYVQHTPRYETSIIKSSIEYFDDIEDALAVSKYVGTD